MTEETTKTNLVPGQTGEKTTARDVLLSNAPQEVKEENSRRETIIQEILQESKLPDRRQFRATGDAVIAEKQQEATIVSERIIPSPSSQEQAYVTSHATPAAEQQNAVIRPLRTFKEDMQELVRVKKMSLVRAAALESDKIKPQKLSTENEVEPIKSVRKSRHIGIIAAFVVLIGTGALALGTIFFVESQRASDVAIPQENSLMFAEQTATIAIDDLSAREIKLLLAQARDQSNVTLGAITRIAPTIDAPGAQVGDPSTLRLVTAPEFLEAIGSHAPDELLRAIGEDFFLGIHAVDHVAPLMVMTVSSYERAFAAMLQWESDMSDGLAPLYPAVLQQSTTQGTSVSVTKFEDAVVRNFDVRVLKDSTGAVKMLYAFPTRNILIIAESPYSFVETLSRLQAERRLE